MNYRCLGDYLKTLPENTVFRVWKRTQESQPLYGTTAYFGYIRAVIDLPDGDLLLAIESSERKGYVDYYRLSEIDIVKDATDMEVNE